MEKPVSYLNPDYKLKDSGLPHLLRNIPALVWLMLIVIALSISSQAGALVAWWLIAFWILRGPDEAIEGLLLSLLIVFLNPELRQGEEFTSIARWAMIFLASIRVAFAWSTNRIPFPSWMKYLFLYTLYIFFTSFIISWWPAASLSKAIIFTLVLMITYFGIKLGHKDWQRNLIAFGMVITLLSLPLLRTPLGYIRNGFQFQGILSHPQSYGIIISLPLAAAIGRWLLDQKESPNFGQILVMLLMGITILLSGARTGYFALAIAFTGALILQRSLKTFLKRIVFNPLTYFLSAGLIGYIAITKPMQQIKNLFLERDVSLYLAYDVPIDPTSSVFANLIASRIGLIFLSWKNFLNSPILGNGFGLPSLRIAKNAVRTVGGIPVNLPYEKGFIGTAVLEESGILGAFLILALIISQGKVIVKGGLGSALMLFLTAVLVNMGESVYFAVGGIGLLVHIVIAAALVASENAATLVQETHAASS